MKESPTSWDGKAKPKCPQESNGVHTPGNDDLQEYSEIGVGPKPGIHKPQPSRLKHAEDQRQPVGPAQEYSEGHIKDGTQMLRQKEQAGARHRNRCTPSHADDSNRSHQQQTQKQIGSPFEQQN
jgi:hypothetical protein